MMTTATINPDPLPILTAADQSWLDATPSGDRRELTLCGRTFVVDRRWTAGYPASVGPRYALDPLCVPSAGTVTSTEAVTTHPICNTTPHGWRV